MARNPTVPRVPAVSKKDAFGVRQSVQNPPVWIEPLNQNTERPRDTLHIASQSINEGRQEQGDSNNKCGVGEDGHGFTSSPRDTPRLGILSRRFDVATSAMTSMSLRQESALRHDFNLRRVHATRSFDAKWVAAGTDSVGSTHGVVTEIGVGS